MRFGHSHCSVPVSIVRVHVDGLFRLPAVEELNLRLLKTTFVLQMHGVLVVNVGQLALGLRACQSIRFLELMVLNCKINGKISVAEFRQQLSAAVGTQACGPRVSDLLLTGNATMSLRNSESVFPLVGCAMHLNSGLPIARFNVVFLSFAKAAFRLELLGENVVRV